MLFFLLFHFQNFKQSYLLFYYVETKIIITRQNFNQNGIKLNLTYSGYAISYLRNFFRKFNDKDIKKKFTFASYIKHKLDEF